VEVPGGVELPTQKPRSNESVVSLCLVCWICVRIEREREREKEREREGQGL
jgi:hypothetical protein